MATTGSGVKHGDQKAFNFSHGRATKREKLQAVGGGGDLMNDPVEEDKCRCVDHISIYIVIYVWFERLRPTREKDKLIAIPPWPKQTAKNFLHMIIK